MPTSLPQKVVPSFSVVEIFRFFVRRKKEPARAATPNSPKTSGMGLDGLLRNAAIVGALFSIISAADSPVGQGTQVQGGGHCEGPAAVVHKLACRLCPLHKTFGDANSGILGTIMVREILSWTPVFGSVKSDELATGLTHSHLGSPRETMIVLKQGPTNVLSTALLDQALQ